MIELLVVMAIIVLLVGILLPALAQSRDAARQTACLSNLKNLQFGWSVGIEQQKGKIPWTRGFGHPNWRGVMKEVLDNAQLISQTARPSFTECPSMDSLYPNTSYDGSGEWGYAINWWWTDPGHTSHVDHQWCNEQKSWEAVLRPSHYPWFIDPKPRVQSGGGYLAQLFAPNPNTGFNAPEWGVGAHHLGKTAANASFADGSARAALLTDIHGQTVAPTSFPWFANR